MPCARVEMSLKGDKMSCELNNRHSDKEIIYDLVEQ